MSKLIQIADEPGDIKTASRVKLVSHSADQVPSLTYLISETAHGSYFSQIMSTKIDLNISARSEFDPASLSGSLKVLGEELGYTRDSIWNTAHYYQAEMLAHEMDGRISAPMTRPGAGTTHEKASAAQICRFTGLPDHGWEIGTLSNLTDAQGQTIPIRVNEHILRHHMLVGGTTGMGKTNGLANIIKAAQSENFATVVYDHKPDYISMDRPNPRHTEPEGIADATFWTLGPSEREDAIPIRVAACELQPEMLASTICWKNGEELMADVLGVILAGFATLKHEKSELWGWDDFTSWFGDFDDAAALASSLPFKMKINEHQFGAIGRRLRTKGRLPSWIARQPKTKTTQWGKRDAQPSPTVDFFSSVRAGSVHVIRVDGDGGDSRSYGLFLDYALGKIAEHRRARGPKVVHVIDEAADIFLSGNTALKNLAVSSLTQHIRKGRSLKIGFVLSVQSAGDVPAEIRQNLNSIVVFKHKNPSILREILPEQASDVFSVVNNLQRGEALVHLFGVRGLIHANMKLSPFKLYEPDEEGA